MILKNKTLRHAWHLKSNVGFLNESLERSNASYTDNWYPEFAWVVVNHVVHELGNEAEHLNSLPNYRFQNKSNVKFCYLFVQNICVKLARETFTCSLCNRLC